VTLLLQQDEVLLELYTMKFKVVPSYIEVAYLQAAAFRSQYGLPVALDRNNSIRPEIIAHDYLHALTGLTPSKSDENKITNLEAHLFYRGAFVELTDLGNLVRDRFQSVNNKEAYATFVRLYSLGI
jgi:hypothetical protein